MTKTPKRTKPKRRRRVLTELQVRKELEKAIERAGGVNALAREAGINVEPIIRARKGGQIRPAVLAMLNLRKSEAKYERIEGSG
jgi:hypothetical protein